MTGGGSGTSGVNSAGGGGGGGGGGVDSTTGLSSKAQGTSTITGTLPSMSSTTTVAVPVVSVLNSQALQDDSGEPAHLRVVKANLRKELVVLFNQHKVSSSFFLFFSSLD
jgi:hypothetical protein